MTVSVAILGLVITGRIGEPQGVIAKTYSDPIMLEFLGGVFAGIIPARQRLRLPVFAGAGTTNASVVVFVGMLPFSVPRPRAFGLPARPASPARY
ncbi:hypothetical protein [Tardiphaga sp. 619_E2_N8_5]|uniref:hypothetical protein n=1 Tax=unclassified Tardiphaga TaxID=2631404 RepID=UPI003F1E68B7